MERRRQTLTGQVVSTKMQKTVVVEVASRIPHKVYKKIIKVSKKYLADVGKVTPSDGDIVRITATRPISKRKCWQVSEIIRESKKVG